MNKTLIVIAGPTAVGKTSFAIQLAKHYNTEIISADSRQFYREMEIGTAKPSTAELAEIPHHFINSLSITEHYSVGDYEKDALKILEGIFRDHNYAILVGGSGLYINAVINGFDDLPSSPPEIREKLNILLEEKGIEYLQELLKEADPDYYSQVDLNNPQRIVRALEVYQSTGSTFSSLRIKKNNERPFDIKVFGLAMERPELYERINTRVDQMIADGLVDEVRRLIPYRNLNALNTVGYTEIFDYLDGTQSLQRAVELIKQNTRRFAKRQMTWFKKNGDIEWIQPVRELVIAGS